MQFKRTLHRFVNCDRTITNTNNFQQNKRDSRLYARMSALVEFRLKLHMREKIAFDASVEKHQMQLDAFGVVLYCRRRYHHFHRHLNAYIKHGRDNAVALEFCLQ